MVMTIRRARVEGRKRRKPKVVKPLVDSKLVAPSRGQIAAIKRLFDLIPLDELSAALESSDDDRAQRLLSILGDKSYSGQAMALKIRAAGLTVAETLKAITTMHRSDADLRVARRLPAIMERMAVESEPHLVPCPRCCSGNDDTADFVLDELLDDKPKGRDKRCPRCRGKREVIKSADNDVRKMVLESQNLLGSKGPLIDARTVNMYTGAPDMTDWSRSSDEALERGIPRRLTPAKPQAEEAETVEPKP